MEKPIHEALPRATASRGSLLVVGFGIGMAGQVTVEALAAIKTAERLFYVAGAPAAGAWLRGLNARAVSLSTLYEPGKRRELTYAEMAECVPAATSERGRADGGTLYGHPGVRVGSGHAAVRVAREEGYTAMMLPGVSAEACLYADTGLNPLTYGCQSYEASAFVVRQPVISTTALLLLWQVGVIGYVTPRYTRDAHLPGLERLRQALLQHYPPEHAVIASSPCPILSTHPPRHRRSAHDASDHADDDSCRPTRRLTGGRPLFPRTLESTIPFYPVLVRTGHPAHRTIGGRDMVSAAIDIDSDSERAWTDPSSRRSA